MIGGQSFFRRHCPHACEGEPIIGNPCLPLNRTNKIHARRASPVARAN
jgi:hypothetical protein